MLFNRLYAIACCTIISVAGFCQKKDNDYKFGDVTAKDFELPVSKVINADDAAIILYESGSTHFIGNKHGWFSYVFTYTKRIKINNKKSFDNADIKIRLYKKDENEEVLSDIKAVTYNFNEGNVSAVTMDKNGIFTEQEDKNHILKKFTFPAVQEGSILEYTYKITSPYTFNMPSWQFQSTRYPVLWSAYEVSIPSTLQYVYVRHGFDSFYAQKNWIGNETYMVIKPADKSSLGGQDEMLTVNTGTINYRWVEKDLKPLTIESFISSPENYIDKIEFQLSGTYNGENRIKVWSTWKSACEELLKEDDYREATVDDNYWIKDFDDLNNITDKIRIAKYIYQYVQDKYTCTDTSNIFKYEDLKSTYKNQKGSVRAINLLLIAMLKKNNIYAEPALLSTRDNGFVNSNYPVIDNFNYLICQATINGEKYLLDATEPSLGFGQIPNKCYNGYVRIINVDNPDSLYLSADSLHEKKITSLFLSNDGDGKIAGNYTSYLGEMESADFRKKMKKINKDDYLHSLKKDLSFEGTFDNLVIDSLDQPEMPVSIGYNVSFKLDEDIVYLNPLMFADVHKENPFKAAQRSYPVEMPYCVDDTYILNMDIPQGYKIDELPKSSRVSLNDNQGMFEYLIQQGDEKIQLRCRIKLNQANFEPEDYETLRNFFAFIVNKESEQIVLKKK